MIQKDQPIKQETNSQPKRPNETGQSENKNKSKGESQPPANPG